MRTYYKLTSQEVNKACYEYLQAQSRYRDLPEVDQVIFAHRMNEQGEVEIELQFEKDLG